MNAKLVFIGGQIFVLFICPLCPSFWKGKNTQALQKEGLPLYHQSFLTSFLAIPHSTGKYLSDSFLYPIPSFRGEWGCFSSILQFSLCHLKFLGTTDQTFCNVLPSKTRIYWCIWLWFPLFCLRLPFPISFIFSSMIKTNNIEPICSQVILVEFMSFFII